KVSGGPGPTARGLGSLSHRDRGRLGADVLMSAREPVAAQPYLRSDTNMPTRRSTWAARASVPLSVTRTARPSTTTSTPSAAVVRTQRESRARLRAVRVFGPAQQ